MIPVDEMEIILEDDLTYHKKTLIYKLGEEGVIIDEAELEALTVYRFKKGELGSTLTNLLKNDTKKGKTTSRDRATYASAFGSDERGRICTDMFFKVLGYSPSDTDATITARLEEY